MKILLDDIKSARWAIMIIIAYFAFLKKILYTLCPITLIIGYPCPGCGITRALFRLLKLDFKGAWEMHPFIYPIVMLVVAFAISRYVLSGKGMKYIKGFLVIVSVNMVIYYIWRMMNYFPDRPPMTYYDYNYINRIREFITRILN